MHRIHFLAAILLLSTAASAKDVDYSVEGKPFQGSYLSAAPGAPLVLILHDWDGLTAYEMKRAEMLNERGYAVFAADLFGAGVRPEEMAERRRLTGELYADRAAMRARMDAALAAARAEGANTENAVVMGYCFGGTAVLEWARSGVALKGFVSFHGGLATPEGQDYQKARGEILVLHGAADTAISLDEFAGLAKELEAQNVPHEMISYSGAPHAFSVFGSERYRATADARSWARLLAFLEEKFGK